jgi:hypothetical protein
LTRSLAALSSVEQSRNDFVDGTTLLSYLRFGAPKR